MAGVATAAGPDGARDAATGSASRPRAKEPTPRSALRRSSLSGTSVPQQPQPQMPSATATSPANTALVAQPWAQPQLGPPTTNNASAAAPGQVVRLGQSPQKAVAAATAVTLLAQSPLRNTAGTGPALQQQQQQQQQVINLEMRPLGGQVIKQPPAQQMAVLAQINPQTQI